ncbi:MAG: DUF1501 domain-containing protein, partial [Gemmataceae bacterium]|nr:DUF1501 domain-containing protein [Gemmataceae bacterium]
MLTISDTRAARHCQGSTRREFLRVGSLALLGGMGLPQLLAAKSKAAAEGRAWKDKSVVLLFLSGGPSHIEFFDPKMTAPEEVRSITGEVKTKLPGVTFGGSFPKLAQMTDKIAVVRSYASMNAGHTYLSVTSGDNPMKAAMGALYARVAGNTNADTGIPNNCLVLPEAVDPKLKLEGNFETGALPTLTAPGDLGPSYAAFDPSGGDQLKKNLQLKVSTEQFADRRRLLAGFDTVRRDLDATGAMEGTSKFQQQAFDVISRGVADAFDLSKEDPKTIAKYDTSGLFKLTDVTKWYDMRRGTNL